MKQSYFAILTSKMNSLTPQNPHVSILRHQIAPKMELQHYIQNLEAKSSSSGRSVDKIGGTWDGILISR